MMPKFRYSLRTFLIATVALGIGLAAVLRFYWQPHIVSGNIRGTTAGGNNYTVRAMVEVDPFRRQRLLSALVIPPRTNWGMSSSRSRQDKPGKGLTMNPNGVFFREQLIGGYGASRVLIVLDETDVRVIPLSIKDINTLSLAAGSALIESPVWRHKVEPEIDRLVAARRNVHDRAVLGLAP